MLAVLLFMPPVPRRAISPKQTPWPSVTKTILSSGPPTTCTAPDDTMNISMPTSPFWQTSDSWRNKTNRSEYKPFTITDGQSHY